MRVAFTGDREWRPSYFVVLFDFFQKQICDDDLLILGDCPTGVDRICEFYAEEVFDYQMCIHRADWKTYGKGAGPIRNAAMLNNGVEKLVAVHMNLERSKGTKNCIEQAQRRNIPVTYLIDTLT